MPRFSKDYHLRPPKEAYERAAKTKSIKLRVSSIMSTMTMKHVFSLSELKKLHPNYKTPFPTMEEFQDAYAAEIMAYNIFRYVVLYSGITNAENSMKVIKHLDVMSIGDLKETINPVFHFDKYESEI